MTPSQRQALEDVKKHGDPWFRVYGQAQHGGWNGVLRALLRKGFLKFTRGTWVVTEAGRAALKKEKRR